MSNFKYILILLVFLPILATNSHAQPCANQCPGQPGGCGIQCGCPTVSVSSDQLAVVEQQIQPGAFDPVDFDSTLTVSDNSHTHPQNGWTICGGTSYTDVPPPSSPTCTVTFYPCGEYQFTTQSSIPYSSGECGGGANANPLNPFDLNGGEICNLYSSDATTTPPTYAYSPGYEGTGSYSLCYTIFGSAIVSPTPGVTASCPFVASGPAPSNPWDASYVVSPYVLPSKEVYNSLLQNPAYTISAPVSVTVADSNGNPDYDIVWPNTATFTVTGDGQYPLWLELAYQGTANCIYGGIPNIGQPGFGPPAESEGDIDSLSLCGQYPNDELGQPQTPCVLAYSESSTGTPTAAPSLSYTIDTTDLPSNTYTVCGYEGQYFGQQNSQTGYDPEPIFSDDSSFFLSCPTSNPTCGQSPPPPPPPPVSTSEIQAEICSLFYAINETLLLLALVLMLIGAILYGASNMLPAQYESAGSARGTMQAYGMGLFMAGLISIIIAVVSIYALSVAAGVSFASVFANSGCNIIVLSYTTTTQTGYTTITTTTYTTSTTTITTTEIYTGGTFTRGPESGGPCSGQYIVINCVSGTCAGGSSSCECSSKPYFSCTGYTSSYTTTTIIKPTTSTTTSVSTTTITTSTYSTTTTIPV